MGRVVVVGTSGTGKTTLAQALAQQLDLVHLELDAVHHLPGWVPIETERFRQEVADTVVWLDLSRARTMWRVTSRSVWRAITRQELWNGNREQWRNLLTRVQ